MRERDVDCLVSLNLFCELCPFLGVVLTAIDMDDSSSSILSSNLPLLFFNFKLD